MRSLLITLSLITSTAHAVPAQFTHQGRLLDADGAPLEDDTTITFRVTDSESGGTALWEDTLTLPLTGGFYSAILGADEDNPLDTATLAQAPVWLELQLDGEEAMLPRSPIHSVPYATMATVAEEVSGGPVDASQIAVDGTPVVNELGEWVGPAPAVNWSDIEGMPADFADGIDDDTDTDSDSFATLGTSCLDGDVPVWDSVLSAWACDIDHDTLAATACLEGQLIRWSDESTSWVCSEDIDTTLTETEVDAMVADNGYALASEGVSGGSRGTVIYTRCAWTGPTMPDIGSCSPPSCPSEWDDLDVTGNVKTALTASGSTDYSPPYSEAAGYQERGCYLSSPRAVLITRCAWTGGTAPDIGECSPPACPEDWTDLGITGNIKSALGMYGSTDYSPPYSEAGGYQERTCTR
jgi:hypothetical protein